MTNATEIRAQHEKQEFFVIREFDAPRETVFEFFTDPALLVQWFLPRELPLSIDFMDCRTGGSYRHVHTHSSGKQFGAHGVFHEVAPPARIVRTYEFEGLPERGHVILEFTTLESLPDERTRVTIQFVFRSIADRDGMINAGFEPTVTIAHQQLDELLARMGSIADAD